MTTIQARAIEKARKEFVRARKELARARLSETTYRGIRYCTELKPAINSHHRCTYRGVPYTS
jgi:hypothetical protein